MPRGNKCPFCNTLTLHVNDSRSFRERSSCGFVGWRLTAPVKPGPGKGKRCVNCRKSTLHSLTDTGGFAVFRCSTCLYAGTRPIKSGVGGEAP